MKKYSPYENCSCISYTDQRSRARSRTDPTKRRVCAIPGQEGGHCCVHFQRGRARVCSAVRHHRLQQSHTRIQSITSLTRSQGGADGRDGALWRDFTVLLIFLPGCANHCSIFLLYIDKHCVCEILLYYFFVVVSRLIISTWWSILIYFTWRCASLQHIINYHVLIINLLTIIQVMNWTNISWEIFLERDAARTHTDTLFCSFHWIPESVYQHRSALLLNIEYWYQTHNVSSFLGNLFFKFVIQDKILAHLVPGSW